MTFIQARTAARRLFPAWSRRMRAKWVVARINAPIQPKVVISSHYQLDLNDFRFVRKMQ